MKRATTPDRAPSNQPHVWAWLRDLWTTVTATLYEFVWRDIRDGMIDLRGLAGSLRATVWLGFVITALCLLLLTQGNNLRAAYPLFTSTTPAPGRGIQIPLPLFPLSAFLLRVAWAYILSGARHSHWTIRGGAVLLYIVTCAIWLTSALSAAPRHVAVGVVLLAMTLIFHLWPRKGNSRPALHFALSLLLVGAFFALMQYALVRQDEASGLPMGTSILEGNIRALATVVIPLLILIGLDIADFTVRVSLWATEASARLLPDTLLIVLTCALAVNLPTRIVLDLYLQANRAWSWELTHGFIGPLLLVSCLWLVWQLLRRVANTRSLPTLDNLTLAAGSFALPLVIVFLLPLLASFLLLESALALQTLAFDLATDLYGKFDRFVAGATSFYNLATSLSDFSYWWQTQWQQAIAAIAILVALPIARRGNLPGALFAATVGINYLWLELTRANPWLQAVGANTLDPLVLAWFLFALAMSLVRLRRRPLRRAQLVRLLLVLLILMLMRLPTLVAAPLDPLFALAGIGYLAVGLGWDLITAGNWANQSSASLPRVGRIYLYLGYVILTAMLVNWAAASHDMNLLEGFTGQGALTGLVLLGYPYLFVAIYLIVADAPLTAPD